MKNDKTGLGGRMSDFEFVVVKSEASQKANESSKKKPEKK